MAKKSEKPFDKIMIARTKLDLFVRHGDAALDGQTFQEFAAELAECMEVLVSFRNIINGMAALDQAPERAALMYIPHDMIVEAASS